MPHHFTKSTVRATFWCTKCGKPTMHRVDGGRRGPCLDCLQKLADKHEEKQPAPNQMGLFRIGDDGRMR